MKTEVYQRDSSRHLIIVFENILARFQSKCLKRKYRGIFGPKTEEVTGE
jgi:hypothetical protein